MSDTVHSSDLTVSEVMNSLTGFDEIAIKRTFSATITALRPEPFSFLRALAFIVARRAAGMPDLEAHTYAMGLSIGQLDNEVFAEDPKDPEDLEDFDDADALAAAMALWCTNHQQSPDTWRQLTRTERAAFDQLLR